MSKENKDSGVLRLLNMLKEQGPEAAAKKVEEEEEELLAGVSVGNPEPPEPKPKSRRRPYPTA